MVLLFVCLQVVRRCFSPLPFCFLDRETFLTDIEPFRDAVFSRADEKIGWLTVPVIHRNDGKACDIRTGVLLQIGDMRFLITAGHNMIAHSELGRSAELVMPDKGVPTIPLSEERFWTTKAKSEDLTVCQLTTDTVAKLGDRFRYASLSDFMSQHDTEQGRGLYLLYGFPNQMGSTEDDGTKHAGTWRYLSCLYEGDRSVVEDYDANLHIILEYERETRNKDGQHVWPHGMSGCGIWFCGHPMTHTPFSSDHFRLVGIQTAWHKGFEYSKGTWIDVVATIIWKYYSDTRDVMRMHNMEF